MRELNDTLHRASLRGPKPQEETRGPKDKSPTDKPRTRQDNHHNGKTARKPNQSQFRVVIVIITISRVPRGVRGRGRRTRIIEITIT